MRLAYRVWWLPVVICAVLLTALPASANAVKVVKTGSGYGPHFDASDNPYSFTDCINLGDPCIGYTSTTFDIHGNSLPGQFYSYNQNGTLQPSLDLIDVGNVASFSLPLIDINGDSGVFACGTGLDSENKALTGLDCTATSISNDFSVTSSGNTEIFTFSEPGNWVVYTADGNLSQGTVPTPEPSSALLLLVGGIMGLFATARRQYLTRVRGAFHPATLLSPRSSVWGSRRL